MYCNCQGQENSTVATKLYILTSVLGSENLRDNCPVVTSEQIWSSSRSSFACGT